MMPHLVRKTTGVVALAILLTGCTQSPSSPTPLTSSVAASPGAEPSGQPVAVLSFQSELGDYVGQGQQAALHLTAAQFQVTLNQSQSELLFRMPFSESTRWSLSLEAPAGRLVPGYYNNATRWPFQLAGVPGLDFAGDGRGCNTLTGRFLIAVAEFSGTQVQRFHARFEQHCEGFSTPLRGQIWIDASGGEPPPLPDFPPSPQAPATAFSYESGPGDFIGKGRSGTFTLSGMKWTARKTSNRPGIDINLQSTSGPLISWRASFTAGSGTLLQPGTYAGAIKFPSNSGLPGLDIGGNSGGCGTVRGSFIVYEVIYGPSQEVLRFHATFEQHCDGAVAALRGEVQITANPWR